MNPTRTTPADPTTGLRDLLKNLFCLRLRRERHNTAHSRWRFYGPSLPLDFPGRLPLAEQLALLPRFLSRCAPRTNFSRLSTRFSPNVRSSVLWRHPSTPLPWKFLVGDSVMKIFSARLRRS